MGKNLYSSYEKTVQATVTKTTHTVRIHLNETAAQVREILKSVPDSATVSFIIGDQEGEFAYAGEIIFNEESIAP
uniref:Uncharacterized protein n=1 Tax=viral metagenome TaxID=1070528 RepID=A0A6M3JZA9_9ZZZZ